MPADPKLIAQLAQEIGDDDPWRPSILHTLTQCPECGRDCWIGPEGVKLLELRGLIEIKAACGICITEQVAFRAVALNEVMDFQFHALNPTEHQVPRR